MSIFLIILHSFSRCVRLIDGSQKVVGFLPVNLRSLLHKSPQVVRWQEITDAIISIGNELSCPQSHDPRLAFRKWCQDIGVLSQKKKNNTRCSWSITRITIHSELCELRNSRLQNMLIFTSRQAIVSDTHGIIRIRPLASSADDVMLTQLGSAHRTKPPHIGVNKIAWLPPYERRKKSNQKICRQWLVYTYVPYEFIYLRLPTANRTRPIAQMWISRHSEADEAMIAGAQAIT